MISNLYKYSKINKKSNHSDNNKIKIRRRKKKIYNKNWKIS